MFCSLLKHSMLFYIQQNITIVNIKMKISKLLQLSAAKVKKPHCAWQHVKNLLKILVYVKIYFFND